MKTLLKLTSVLFITLIFLSCYNEDGSLENLKNDSLTFDQLFEEITSLKIDLKDEHLLFIEYSWDKSTNLIKVLKTTEKEPSFFIIEEGNNTKKTSGSYTITCDNGGDGSDDWTKTCNGKISCGKLLYECINGGGCGTICKKVLAYAPKTRTFYLLK